jgi:hypothetical protein
MVDGFESAPGYTDYQLAIALKSLLTDSIP